MRNGVSSSTVGVDKKTRRNEDNSDLQALVDGVAPSNPDRDAFIFDNIDIPAMINYLTAGIIWQDFDRFNDNFFLYRDTNSSREWTQIPFDKDLTFGNRFLDDEISGDGFTVEVQSGLPPEDHRAHPFQTADAHNCCGPNWMNDALIVNPRTREMYLRRLRTLMDQQLQPSVTPSEDLRFEARIDELAAEVAPDAALDLAKWGAIFGIIRDFSTAIDLIKTDFLEERRVYLYQTHGAPSGVGIPDAQVGNAALTVGQIEFDPVSGNQEEEYLEIINSNTIAVDISGWRIEGTIEFTIRQGTVIPAGDTLYISPNVNAFRSRSTGPGSGQQVFVQGGYDRKLSNSGGTVRIVATDGELITSESYTGSEPPIDPFLRISEIHYHPMAPTSDEIAAGHDDDDDFEFVELVNIGAQTIQLIDARFIRTGAGDEGLAFDFFDSPITQLDPGQRVLVVEDIAAFEFRYGDGLPVAGKWTGQLSNVTELITLIAGNATIHQFAYDATWYPETNGLGHSLQIVDATNPDTNVWGEQEGWRPSSQLGGTPGTADLQRPAGDMDVDFDDIDDFVLGLTNPAAYEAMFGVPPSAFGDLDGDGDLDFDDIDDFVAVLTGNFSAPALSAQSSQESDSRDVVDDFIFSIRPGANRQRTTRDAGEKGEAPKAPLFCGKLHSLGRPVSRTSRPR